MPEPRPSLESEDTKKILAALGYVLWIPAIILLAITKKDDRWFKFHAWQGIFYGGLIMVLGIVIQLLLSIIWLIPYLNVVLKLPLNPITNSLGLLGLVFLVIGIYFGIKAYNKETFRIPILYDIMKKFVKIKRY